MVSAVRPVLLTSFALQALACSGSLNQTSITCPSNRTLLDGVCVSEQVADYVACVRAQGAQLDAKSNQAIAADASYLGAKAGGAAELSETLSKKYAASDRAMLAVIEACNGAVKVSATAGASTEAESKLVAHWKFDEAGGSGVADASGRGNTGTIVGTPAWVPGKLGNALKLDGSQFVEVAEHPSLHAPNAITLAGWIFPTRTAAPWTDFVIKSDTTAGNWWGCRELPDKRLICDGREYGVNIETARSVMSAYSMPTTRRDGTTHELYCPAEATPIPLDRWTHVASVISPRDRVFKLYVDGKLATSCPLSEAPMQATKEFTRIGVNWSGMLDDVRIYADALSDADVAALAAMR